MRAFAALFLVFIVYGSLYPFSGWAPASAAPFTFLMEIPQRLEKADLLQNLLAYMPFGLFLAAWLRRSVGAPVALFASILAGAALSVAMEGLQQYLPMRYASSMDVALNVAGSVIGALLGAHVFTASTPDAYLPALRRGWVRPGSVGNLGLAALALWALSQTVPLLPSLDIMHLRHGASRLYHGLFGSDRLVLAQAATYACNLAALGLLTRTLLTAGKPARLPFALLVCAVLAAKLVIEGRQLSLEAVSGAALALAMLAALPRTLAEEHLSMAGIALLGAAFTIAEMASVPGAPRLVFNWIPLAGQMNSLAGMQNILDLVWPFFAMAYFARLLTGHGYVRQVALGGAGAVLAAVFVLEWGQQALPGRYGDITQVGLALLGWLVPWMFRGDDLAASAALEAPDSAGSTSSSNA